MNDTNKLLNQLRIDREPEPIATSGVSRKGLWLGLGGAIVVAATLSGYALLRPHQAEAVSEQPSAAVKTAEAQTVTVAAAPTASDNAVLNASGYIVARRQATVSAKLTGRVTEVMIDEGKAVKEGDVIAVLDDTNLRAAADYSRAQLDQARASQRAADVALANEAPL
ncbi:MAG TPA: biotin/lipoyl-binding protein, partial [Candidatus Acidoferrum sp.]|nr:biotin/lipoyl-binding protein [Candidatus Acidoferrum sp.]